MLLTKNGETIKRGGSIFTIGAKIVCSSHPIYEGLGGTIIEIRTDGDVFVSNPEKMEIIAKLIPPALPKDSERINKALGAIVDSAILERVTLTPSQTKVIDSGRYPKITLYTLIESWADDCVSEQNTNTYVFISKEDAIVKLNERFNANEERLPSDYIFEFGDDYIECYEDGHFCENNYCLHIRQSEIEIDSITVRNIFEFAEKEYYLEDAKGRLDEEEYATGLTEAESEALLTDALADRIDRALEKNDSYADAYWSSIDSVLKEEISSYRGEGISVHDYADRITTLILLCRKKGAFFDHRFYDNEHLECFWYDGASVATVEYKDHLICFDVHGDISLFVNEEHIRHTGGSAPLFKDEACRNLLSDDATLIKLTREGSIEYSNNNWIDVLVFNQDTGAQVFESEVASETNLLKAVENSLESYFKRIDALIEGASLSKEVSQ